MTLRLVTDEKIAETSSKGNQEKWYDQVANRWYKPDQCGYEALVDVAGLPLFPQYLTPLFEIDALSCNDDRHLDNITVPERDGQYNYCPIFDNGAGLLSNTQLSPMDISPPALIPALQARPFNTTFTRQMNTARSLYGPDHTEDEGGACPGGPAAAFGILSPAGPGIIADRVEACILLRQKKL